MKLAENIRARIRDRMADVVGRLRGEGTTLGSGSTISFVTTIAIEIHRLAHSLGLDATARRAAFLLAVQIAMAMAFRSIPVVGWLAWLKWIPGVKWVVVAFAQSLALGVGRVLASAGKYLHLHGPPAATVNVDATDQTQTKY